MALLDPVSFPPSAFKVAAVKQLLATLVLFDEALLPGRQVLLNNAKLWAQVSPFSLQVCVEDFEFSDVQVYCDGCLF